MLIIDRTQRAWATLSAVVCVVAGAVYFSYANWSANGPSGGSVPGLIFGIIAAAMMVFAGLLAARRRFPAARIGSAQFWMKGHLWIGTLTVPFALFHAGFGLGGRVEILLWILFFGVILSGFWGLLLQQLLPRMMFENLPRETFIEQIPHLCDRFTAESDCLLAEVCGPLEATLTPLEIKRFESHWKPHFEEDRKKNRNDYPKTASDAAHFEKYLSKIYAGLPATTQVKASEPPAAAVSAAAPVMKSVAQIKEKTPEPATVATEAPAAKPKPDPKALLAAMKAKAAAAASASDSAEAAAPGGAPAVPPPAVAPAKPDPRAMLAAAKAKKALETAEPASIATTDAPTPSGLADAAPAKPDPKALLAAARAKKAAAEAAAPPQAAPTEPVAEVAPSVVPAKPDPKAMLAAAKAKKALDNAAATAAAPAETPAVPEATPPTSSETSPVVAKPKADPRAMLAAAKAKREAAAAGETPSVPVAEPAAAAEAPASEPAPIAAGKPDPKAMMAALKAKKEAAAQQAAAGAAATPAPVAKANPLAQLKAVKEPASPPSDLVAAAKVAPPTATQLKELKLFYLELIRPQLPLQPATQAWREAIRRSIMVCQIRSDNQHPQFIPIFDQLLDLCEQRQQFAMIQRYHFWLHGWLLVHIPVTVALYVVLLAHAVVALRVIPFGN